MNIMPRSHFVNSVPWTT